LWEVLPPSTVILLPFRHPDLVARSFGRWGMTREDVLGLWLQLNRLALQAVDTGWFEAVALNFDDRLTMAENLHAVLGSYVDPYSPRLVTTTARTELSRELADLYRELRARARRRPAV
jgi:hypothetical protein